MTRDELMREVATRLTIRNLALGSHTPHTKAEELIATIGAACADDIRRELTCGPGEQCPHDQCAVVREAIGCIRALTQPTKEQP